MCATCSPKRIRKSDTAPSVAAAVSAPAGSVLEATRAALIAANALSTPMGQASLVLAACIDDTSEPLSARTQAVKQLREALSSVVAPEQAAPADPNDEFTRKRLAREHGA
jgi:hypothetical protein